MKSWSSRTAQFLAAILVIAIAGPISQARATDTPITDPTYGTQGVTTISIPKQPSTSEVSEVLIDANGKTIALVNINVWNNQQQLGEPRVVIARYLLDGPSDETFGDGSGSTTPLALTGASIALQGDGKILLVGLDYTQTSVALVVRRYLPTGKIDTSFATDGIYRLVSLPNRSFKGRALVTVNSVGQIILATEINNGNESSTNFYFVALTKFGTENYAFNYGGSYVGEFFFEQGSSSPELFAVKYLATGGFLALGKTGGSEMILLKFNVHGVLDTSFGGTNNVGGIVTVSFPNQGYTKLTTMIELPNGHLAVAGIVSAAYLDDWFYAMALFDENGIADTSFNATGFLKTNVVATEQTDVHGIVKQASGPFYFPVYSGGDVALMRIDEDGSNPFLKTFTPALEGRAISVALQNQKLVIGGSLGNSHPTSVVIRAADATASTVVIQENHYQELELGLKIEKLVPLGDGKILGLGSADTGSMWGESSMPLLFRLNADGSVDSSFGDNGFVLVNNASYGEIEPSGLAVQDDGKIVVVAQANDNQTDVLLFRTTSTGVMDTAFGIQGFLEYDSGGNDYPSSLIIDSEQRILVANNLCCDVPRGVIVRFSPNGQLDTGFDGTTALATLGDSNSVAQIKLDANQKIVLVGSAATSGSLALVARLLPNGQLDSEFSEDGFTLLDLDDVGTSNRYSYFQDFVITTTGKIAAIGGGNTPEKREAVVFFESNGNLDTSRANQTGITRYESAAAVDYAEATSIVGDGDGFLVVGGGAVDQSSPNSVFATVVRFGSNGLLDTSFDEDGVHLPDTNGAGFFTTVSRINVQQSLVGGYVLVDGIQQGLLMRIGVIPTVVTTPSSSVPQSPPSSVETTQTTVPTTVPTTSTTVPATVTTGPVVVTTVPVATTMPQVVMAAAEPMPLKLVISVSQATILKNMKLTVPKGGVATMSVAKSSAKVCKVVKKQVVGTAIGTCRVSVTIKMKTKKNMTKSMAFKVSG